MLLLICSLELAFLDGVFDPVIKNVGQSRYRECRSSDPKPAPSCESVFDRRGRRATTYLVGQGGVPLQCTPQWVV